jgi:hypothetical protein
MIVQTAYAARQGGLRGFRPALRLFPVPQGAAAATGRDAIWWRAADAGDLARSDAAAEAPAARRAIVRSRAADRGANLPNPARHQPQRRRWHVAGRTERPPRPLVGIRVGWMLAFGWGLAGAIGAVAGMMAAPIVYLDPNMMSGNLLYGFAGALLGGIDNPWGAAFGGFFLGVLENIAPAYLVGTERKLTVALVIAPCRRPILNATISLLYAHAQTFRSSGEVAIIERGGRSARQLLMHSNQVT